VFEDWYVLNDVHMCSRIGICSRMCIVVCSRIGICARSSGMCWEKGVHSCAQ
jgi:hypothetical protein